MFAEARRRGSASMFAAASQLRARQRLWTGPIADAVVDARAAFDVWRGALHMYLHPAAYCLVSGLLEQDEPDAAEKALALGEREPAAVGFFAAWRYTAIARSPRIAARTARRWRRSFRAAGTLASSWRSIRPCCRGARRPAWPRSGSDGTSRRAS